MLVYVYEGQKSLIRNYAFPTMTTTNGFSVRQFFMSAVLTSALLGAMSGIASADSSLGVSVDIGANGKALVRGAEVIAVSDSEVKAETSWGSTVLNWVVKTDSNTEYVGNNGKDITRTNIAVGDTISFRGSIDQTMSGLVVQATVIKDWTKTDIKTKLQGTVSSINTSLNSFVVTHGNGTTTVTTSSSTEFDMNGKSGSFSDLFVNAKVKIKGFFTASTSAFTATEVDIATSTKTHGWNGDDKKDFRDWIRSKVWFKSDNHGKGGRDDN